MDIILNEQISEEDIINNILDDMDISIENNDLNKISKYVIIIANMVRELITEANFDCFRCHIVKVLNRIISTDKTINYYACNTLEEQINEAINNIKFQKKSLIVLRDSLKYFVKKGEFSDLPLIFSILICILVMKNNENLKMDVDVKKWETGLSGITYYPAKDAYRDTEEYKKPIIEGVNKLKKKLK